VADAGWLRGYVLGHRL